MNQLNDASKPTVSTRSTRTCVRIATSPPCPPSATSDATCRTASVPDKTSTPTLRRVLITITVGVYISDAWLSVKGVSVAGVAGVAGIESVFRTVRTVRTVRVCDLGEPTSRSESTIIHQSLRDTTTYVHLSQRDCTEKDTFEE